MHAANSGMPLTHAEVRWLHTQIEKAHAAFVSNADLAGYDVFDPSTPDGSYFYTPAGEGIHFRSLALPLGTCVASYRNPKSSPVLDCARLAQRGMP